MERFELNDGIYKSRPAWHTYQANIQQPLIATRRIILNSWEFPDISYNGIPITQLAVTITSNLGTTDVNPNMPLQHRSSILAGEGVKQIIFNKGEDGKWIPVNGISSLNYPSKSMTFDFKLRMAVRGMGFTNIPLTPKRSWKLNVTIA